MKDIIRRILKESLEQAPQVSDYRAWLRTVVKPSKISQYKKINNVDAVNDMQNYQENMQKNKDLTNFIINNVEPNECFHNAYKAFVLLKQKSYDVKFVLGLMSENGQMFGHAWNIVNGVPVDFTAEKLQQNQNKYFQVAVLDNQSQIQGLDVFNPEKKCAQAFNSGGESYDKNGMCSVYPYYTSIKGI